MKLAYSATVQLQLVMRAFVLLLLGSGLIAGMAAPTAAPKSTPVERATAAIMAAFVADAAAMPLHWIYNASEV